MRQSDLPPDVRDLLLFKMTNPSQMGQWLRDMRQFTGVGAPDVAAVLGLDRRTILSIERGDYNPTLGRAIELAGAHKCSLYWVRDGIEFL